MKLRYSLKLLTPVFLNTVFINVFMINICIAQNKTPGKSASAATLKTAKEQQEYIANLENFIPELMKEANIPGLVIAVIKNAEIIWNGNFGVKDIESQKTVDNRTVFQAASLSKTVFAYSVLKLVEKGTINLDTPLSEYLPSKYLENDERIDLITARMVLSHTTGFPNWRPQEGELQIHFKPGEKFSYSGEGFVYLQKVIEHLTGKSLNEFMQETVFYPLDMARSSYVWREEFKSNYAIGHTEFGVAINREHMIQANAAASLYTTASDYAKFVVAILSGVGLKNKTLREMLTAQVQLNPNCVNCTQNKSPERSAENAWGLGWGLQNTKEGTSFWHWGNQGIFHCYTAAFTNSKTAVVYFTNSANGLSIRNEMVLQTIGGLHPAFDWLRYTSYKSPSKKFSKIFMKDGLDAAMAFYTALQKKDDENHPVFEERAVNSFGYHLLRIKKFDDAIAVFKLNVQDYPSSSNVYDSLGEAYMENGQVELAIKNYRKSVELNPDNENGKNMLKKLTGNIKLD